MNSDLMCQVSQNNLQSSGWEVFKTWNNPHMRNQPVLEVLNIRIEPQFDGWEVPRIRNNPQISWSTGNRLNYRSKRSEMMDLDERHQRQAPIQGSQVPSAHYGKAVRLDRDKPPVPILMGQDGRKDTIWVCVWGVGGGGRETRERIWVGRQEARKSW